MAARKKQPTEPTGSVTLPTGSIEPTGSAAPTTQSLETTSSLAARAEDNVPVFATPVKFDPNTIQARVKIICTDLMCVFDGEGSTGAPGCSIKNHKWNIDGQDIGGSIVTHTFTRPGTYSITLTVWDNCKNTTTITEQLKVG